MSIETEIREIVYKATSDMLDNPYGNGLYPTSVFYERMDKEIAALFRAKVREALDRLEKVEDTEYRPTEQSERIFSLIQNEIAAIRKELE